MAEITLGIGTSHGPMLTTPPDKWHLRVKADQMEPAHPFRGAAYDFEALVDLRKEDGLAAEIAPEMRAERFAACQNGLARLADIYADAAPDVAVIFGNDQREVFGDDHMSAFTVYWGETIEAVPRTAEQLAKAPPGIAEAELAHCPPERTTYQCEPALGRHIIEGLMEDGFDAAQSTVLPTGSGSREGIPHAFGFIYRQIMKDNVIPNVPVILNTFYPPNQPGAGRCFDFGRAVGRAIRSWDQDVRVAIFASGGLSHFVIDEAFDAGVIACLQENDEAGIKALEGHYFRSGTSEVKNWIAAMGALSESGLAMELVDYVPCYRSEAGTGNAMAFAAWR